MNCNEEFVTKALGQLTLELGFDMPTQFKYIVYKKSDKLSLFFA